MNQDISGKKWNYKSTRKNLNRKCLSNSLTQNIDAINKNKFDYIKLKIFKGGKKPTISESKHTQLTGKKIFATPTEDNI